jgi:molybdate transport system substrate-binding protein
MRSMISAAGLLAAFAVFDQGHTAEVVVWTSQASIPNVNEVAAAFSRASGNTVQIIQVGGAGIDWKTAQPADVIALDPEKMDEFGKKGIVVAGTDKPWVRAGLGVSVRAGAPKPDISTVEGYKTALLAAKSIGYSLGCSGVNIEKGIQELGIADQLKSKTVHTGSQAGGGPVTEHLAKGEFELGIQQANIMVGVEGTDFVGPLPAPVNKYCSTRVGLATAAKHPDAGRALIAFMLAPEAVPLLRKTYVEPDNPE